VEPNLFQQLYQQYYAIVYRICKGYFKGDTELAGDMVQEVFIKVWERHDFFKNECQVSTWIYRITVNVCLTEIRRQKNYTNRINRLDPVGESQSERMLEETDILNRCIARLNEPDRVLALLILEDLTQQDIAQILGLTEVNARVRIHRLKEKLKKIYQEIENNI
jgi:RNA polymerase sigma-70 factor (ECF subfamily)